GKQRGRAGKGPAPARPGREEAGRQGSCQGVSAGQSRRQATARRGAAQPRQALMHPNPLFRLEDRTLLEALIDEVGFGMVFAQAPHGRRVAHVPLFSPVDGALHFHLSRGNALAQHVAATVALAVINGPAAYVSPRWYDDRGQVQTWN